MHFFNFLVQKDFRIYILHFDFSFCTLEFGFFIVVHFGFVFSPRFFMLLARVMESSIANGFLKFSKCKETFCRFQFETYKLFLETKDLIKPF
jgi:hypothetical protein